MIDMMEFVYFALGERGFGPGGWEEVGKLRILADLPSALHTIRARSQIPHRRFFRKRERDLIYFRLSHATCTR